MAKVNDIDFYHKLRELGYHIPDHCTDLKLDAPMNSPVYVTCRYMLYKNDAPEKIVQSSMLTSMQEKLDNEILGNYKDLEIEKLKSSLEYERKARKYLQKDYDDLLKRYYKATI